MDSSEGLRRDAILLFVLDIVLGLYYFFKHGFNTRLGVSLLLNLVILVVIISLCDSNPKAAGIVGILYVVFSLFGGSIIFTLLGIIMLIRSIKTIMEN